MKAITITTEQSQFIRENYKQMSMIDMSKELNIPLSRIRNYMIKNKLRVSKEQIQAFRVAKFIENEKQKPKAKPEKHIPFQWLPY